MNNNLGIAAIFRCFLLLLLLFCSVEVHGQPPERFRLDFTVLYGNFSDVTGYLSGNYAARVGLVGPTNVLALLDLSGTLNVTEHLSIYAGIPFGVVQVFRGETPLEILFDEGELRFGIGDVYTGVGYQLLRERMYLPGVHVTAEFGIPTAEYAGLGVDTFRKTGIINLSKSFGPTFSLIASGSYTDYSEKNNVDLGYLYSYGLGFNVGIGTAGILSFKVDQISSSDIKENGQVVIQSTDDVQISLGVSIYSKGRPRGSLQITVGQLDESYPSVTMFLRWAILSL